MPSLLRLDPGLSGAAGVWRPWSSPSPSASRARSARGRCACSTRPRRGRADRACAHARTTAAGCADPVASGGPSTAEATPTVAEPAVTATPTAAATAPTPPTACWAAYGFTGAQAEGLRAALGASGLPRGGWQLAGEFQLGGR
ncbi:MAG: hypothetical protein MZW92_19850, partial [Comamonadaceae bacterium]|nr:hypothetical protein [Comamonadaceae bacterium]